MEMTNERVIVIVLFVIAILVYPIVKPIIKEFFGRRNDF